MKRYYFDSAASMPVLEQVWQRAAAENPSGNPSSRHSVGVRARKIINRARKEVADYLGSDEPRQIYFTSGATEAANLLIQGYTGHLKEKNSVRNEIIVSAIEHPAVYQTACAMESRGFVVRDLPVNRAGTVEVRDIEALIGPKTAMVCVMAVNNETGAILPVNELARTVKQIDPNVFVVCDAVQAFAKLDWNVDLQVVDALFMSGHKIGAERGVGCFYLNRRFPIQPLLYGGDQETAYRPGTENVWGINLLREALRENLDGLHSRVEYIRGLRNRLLDGLSEARVSFQMITEPKHSSPYIVMLAFPGISSKILLEDLDASGFCVSSRAACSSHKATPSRVLLSMGVPESLSSCAIRISFSNANLAEDVDALVKCLVELWRTSR